jgi:glutaryl-CoA dehydrogenase
MGKRAVWQAQIDLTDVRVPVENKLAHACTFEDTSRVLSQTRGGAAWECVGHAMACLDAALSYAQERCQFGKPIAGFQLVQSKLATMVCETTAVQLLCFRLAALQERGAISAPRGIAGEAAQRQKGQTRVLRGSRHPGRQRVAARVSSRSPPDRPEGRRHLRGHGLDPVADRRA